MLKAQNEELSSKLRRSEGILSRVKEELARYRAANGKNPCIHIEEEQRLNNKLKVSFVLDCCILYSIWRVYTTKSWLS